MQIDIDHRKCCGAGMCVVYAPDVFDQDEDDGTVVLLDTDPPEDRRSAVQEAASMCPVRAIRVAPPA